MRPPKCKCFVATAPPREIGHHHRRHQHYPPPSVIFAIFPPFSFFMEEMRVVRCLQPRNCRRVNRRSLAALNETRRTAVGNTFDGIPCSLLWRFKVKRLHRFIHRFSPSKFASGCGSSLILNSTGNCGRSPCSRFPDVRCPVPTS